jgi:hypothetical protein
MWLIKIYIAVTPESQILEQIQRRWILDNSYCHLAGLTILGSDEVDRLFCAIRRRSRAAALRQ